MCVMGALCTPRLKICVYLLTEMYKTISQDYDSNDMSNIARSIFRSLVLGTRGWHFY